MALPNRQRDELDVLIEATLQQGTGVSQQQKQFAWERLSHTVQYQSILPEAVTLEEKSFAFQLMTAAMSVLRQLSAFATEEDRYKQANYNLNMMRYRGVTHSGEIVMQLL